MSILVLFVCFAYISAKVTKKDPKALSKLETMVREMPDSVFEAVEMEDLLNDEVYLKLAHEGWSQEEIVNIMSTAIADKKAAKKKIGYGYYAKQWLPTYGRQPGGDSLYMFIDTLFTEKMRQSVRSKVPAELLDAYYPEILYNPEDRKNGIRRPGYFRPVKFDPCCGRIHWMALHPEDPDKLYVVPDGAGIFKTDDCGKHWECITDRIPDRANRSNSPGYAIPVDPDDWDHIFAFMNNATVYESCDGGQSWRRIQGATHKSFKRGDCFRDADGNLKFIGCTTTSWNSNLWISEDTCKTWTAVQVPDSLKDIHPSTGAKGLWFQYIYTDPNDRNRIWLPTSRSILYFDDGAKSTIENGVRKYNIKKLHFEVYDSDHNERRYATLSADKGADPANDAIFPCPGTHVGDMAVNPNNPNQMWFATGTNVVGGAIQSALYRTDDRGKTWVTIQDVPYGIGSGFIFGNELPSTWLGGFGLNFVDNTKVYGCSQNSAKSFDGGRTFTGFSWNIGLRALYPDGQYYKVASSRHNADNHCIRSHKTGRVFRGSDGGMLMLDPNVNGGEWTQIGGDMGQMLMYHIAVNEFGDQVMAGNSQDLDGQTYRYGRWGKWRGYEGSESFINPYTSAVYFPNTGLQGLQSDMITIDSWQNGTTRADVVSGSWFTSRWGSKILNRSLLRCDDQGSKLVNLEPNVGERIGGLLGKFALARDKGRTTLFVVNSSHYFLRSTDLGETFEPILYNGQPAKFSNALIAADPNNSDILYIGQQGKVHRWYLNESRIELMGEGLPNIACSHLMFHEGSGDLYFQNSASAGIYILEYDKETGQYATNWRYWTKGYNSGKSSAAEINYTTQEMVIYDYGRGVWCADLEHPSDRYFENGFNLRELSFADGRRTIGIDTEWTIPLYYHYKWYVNDEEIDNPYQYLRRALNPGDKVQLELTLRESPDVHTLSSVFIVPEAGEVSDPMQSARRRIGESGTTTYDSPVAKLPGHALYSNGKGRIDLGYVDYFFNDFTVDFWLKPMSDGTILANRTRNSDYKGWELSISNGALVLEYAPRNVFTLPFNETGTQSASITGGSMNYNEWNHVAITHERYGTISIYLNGKKVASGNRIIPESTLNNSCVLSLFGDAIEQRTVEATVDELKIWSMALSEEQVRREMYSTNADNKDGLVAYYPFNGGSLENEVETFTRKPVKSRVSAEVQYPMMIVPTCAKQVAYETISDFNHTFTCEDRPLLSFKASTSDEASAASTSAGGTFGVYAFDASQWQNEEDNLDTNFFDYYPVGYLIHDFSNAAQPEGLQLEFHPFEGDFDANKDYRLYAADTKNDKQVWEINGKSTFNAENGSLIFDGISMSDISGKKLLIATAKPAIELSIEGVDASGILNIYDESMTTFPMSANILANLPEPDKVYTIDSDGIVNTSGLYFAERTARGELRLDLSRLGTFNSTVRATLRSSDNPVVIDDQGNTRPSMIPYTLDVRNRIVPRDKGTAVRMANSSIDIGNTGDYSSLNGTRNLTMMGWMRVDSTAMLNMAGYNVMTFFHTTGNRISGIRLNRGVFNLAYNASLKSAGFSLTQDDLGKWVHVAAVFTPTASYMYLNGQQQVFSSSNAALEPVELFHFGKNSPPGSSSTNDTFSGAFDQVAIWGRALTQDEIVKYMFTSVPLNDDNLVNFLNMDYADDSGTRRDSYSLSEIKAKPLASGGSVVYDEVTPFPYDARAIASASEPEGVITIDFPAGKERKASIVTFRGTPYNYLNHNFQTYTTLNQEYYGLTYLEMITATKTPTPTDTVTLTYRHRTITSEDNIALAMREMGTSDHMSGFIEASSIEPGIATFKLPLTYISTASELMFFLTPREGDDPTEERPATIQMSFANTILPDIDMSGDTPTYVLESGVTTIPIVADIIGLGRNNDVPVKVVVNESNYATPSQQTIDFSTVENKLNIEIDRSKIDKFGINTLTINLEGAVANELKLNFYLEPFVELTLKNGEEREIVTPENSTTASVSNTYRAYNPVASLDISAELIEGYLPEGTKVELEVVSDLPHSLNIGNGTLLHNEAVTIDNLEHYASEAGALHEGWNLIGNPYLTNLNLTKEQNVVFDADRVTKFIYQADPATGNYKVYNMTSYDASHKVSPFHAYFVQAMAENAYITITPVAKEVSPTKRTMSYNLTEHQAVTFELLSGDKVIDEVTIDLDENGNNNFEINEDAVKMWSISGKYPELYSLTNDGKEVAINVTNDSEINLGVKASESETTALTLSLKSVTGLNTESLTIKDNTAQVEWKPTDTNTEYNFTASGQNDERFTLQVAKEDIPTGLDGKGTSEYAVLVDENTCMVTGLQGNAAVSVFTPNGLMLINTHTSESGLSFDLADGIYIVIIRENGKEFTSKIMI